MPLLFQAVLLTGITCYFLSALLFDLTRDMPRLNPGIGWWALSSIAGGIGYFGILVYGTLGDEATGEALYNISLLSWSAFLYLGMRQWIGRPAYIYRVLTIVCAVTAVVVYYSFINPRFLPAAIATSLGCGLMNLSLAWCFFQDNKRKNHRDWVLIAALCISGLHWLDYPYLRHHPDLGPFGFLLCAIISSTINIFLAAMVITQFKTRMLRSERQAIDRAMHDPLTGLKNRLGLEEAFEQSAELARLRKRHIALIFCDLDKFKQINDEYGHDAGDQILIAIGGRINTMIRSHDVATRLGGDEFVIMLSDLDQDNCDHLVKFISRLIETLGQPISVDAHLHRVGVSIGESVYPKNGTTLHELLIKSDQSMYLDKAMKRNRAQKPIELPLNEAGEECKATA